MLTGLLCFLAVLPVTLGIDWLVCTRIAAYRIDYEYSYRPSAVRYALLALLAATTAYGYANYDPAKQPIATLIVTGLTLAVWGHFVLRDVERGLVPSELAPKRYADTEY